MTLLFRKKKGLTLSVDLGSLTAKILVTEGQYPDSFRIVDFRIVHLRNNNKAMNQEDIARVLYHTLDSLDFNPATVRSVLSTRQEVVRVVEMPTTSRSELKKTAGFQLGRHVPFNQQDAVYDCVPLTDYDKKDVQADTKVPCLLVAVRRDIADSHNAIFKESGIVPLLLDVEPVAVMNAYLAAGVDFEREKGLEHMEEGSIALIHVGAQHTDLSVLENRMPVACRAIEFNMQDVASLLDKNASQLPGGSPGSQGDIERLLAHLSSELQASLNYCARHYNVRISRIILSGGGGEYEELRSLLEHQLEIPAFRFDPFVKTDLTPLDTRVGEFRAHASAFVPAMGVAVRKLSP